MSHRGPEGPLPAGTLPDFVQWRLRNGSWRLVGLWLLIPAASVVGACANAARGDVVRALGALAIGLLALVWFFLPVLTNRYARLRDHQSEARR